MGSEFDQQKLVGIFVAEASDGVTTLTKALHPTGESAPTPQQLQEQYIVAHRIRGAAALYGYSGIAQLSERLEALLEQAPNIPDVKWLRTVSGMRELVQGILTLIQAIGRDEGEDRSVVEHCLTASEGLLPETSKAASPVLPESLLSQESIIPVLDAEVLSYFIPEANECLDAIDGLVPALRANAGDEDAIYRLFRAAHTLKGSAYTVGFQVIGDIAHPMEDCMVAVREKRVQLSGDLLAIIAQAAGMIRLILRRDHAYVNRLQGDVPAVIRLLGQLRDGKAIKVPSTLIAMEASSPEAAPVSDPAQPARSSAVEADQPDNLADDYLVPHLDPEVMSYFAPEAQEYLETLEANLLRLDKDPANNELINQLFRTAHTLKGSAYTVGFQSIGDLVHHVEDFMGAVRDNHLKILPGHTDLMLRSVDIVRVLMRRDLSKVAGTRHRFGAALSELKRLTQGTVIEATPAHQAEAVPLSQGEQRAGLTEDQAQGTVTDGKSVADREVIRVSRDRLEQLLNLVGELVIGRGRLEQRLQVLERLSQQVLACKTRLVDAVQSFEEKHTFTYQAEPSGSVDQATQGLPGLSDFGSLELDKYDDFNILARRISEITADISESMSQLNGSIRRSHDDMSQLHHLTLGMRDEIARARMVPIGTPFTRFRRAIREIARASNKEVVLVTSGEQTEVDTSIVERLVDPLIHLVRNAVYHGIESATVRVANGKRATGTVYLHAAHRGNSVIIEVEDDGGGLDLEKIRAKAVKLGLVRADQAPAMPDAEVIKLIFSPGFSTADRIDDQAGRGVGLDVVKRVIEGMNGHIDVESVLGVGTKFTLDLPLTLLIATALLVRAGEECYAIPLPSIREVTMPTESSLQRMGDQVLLHLGEEAIEVQSLRHVLRRELGEVDREMPIVIVRTPAGPKGLVVDELLGRQEIVIKTLGSLKPLERSFFGGATIDPEGRVILVVDPNRLVASESREPAGRLASSETKRLTDDSITEEAEQTEQVGVPILLVDDSLSIRKFVGRMLESAGYQVDTAVDGEDGLRKACASDYRLIITDLEMPKLNGFEIIQALRTRPQTQQTPIVVMTTRAGDKHRQMAINIGANSYIAKPVEEWALLQEVGRWVGRAPAVRK